MARDYWFAFGSGNPATYTGLNPTFIKFINSAGGSTTPPAISEPLAGSGLYKANHSPFDIIAFVLDGATTGLATADRYIAGIMDPYDMFGGTLTAIGSSASVLAVGSTLNALGTTTVAVGNTLTAIGTGLTNQGSTLVAIGNTSSIQAVGSTLTAIGSTLFQGQTNLGLTLVAIGNTSSIMAVGSTLTAIGATLLQGETNFGTTLVAIGNSMASGATLSAIGSLLGTTASLFGDSASDPTTVFGFLKRAQEVGEGNQTYTKSTGILQLFARGGATLIQSKTIADSSTQTTKG